MNVRTFFSHVSPALLLVPLLSGCVIFHRDPKRNMQPAMAQLQDFAGTYRNSSTYPVFGNDRIIFSEIQSGYTRKANGHSYSPLKSIMIDARSTGNIVITGDAGDNLQVPVVRYTPKDYKFEDGSIIFDDKIRFVGDDSPTPFLINFSMRWMLDEKQRLVVVYSGNGAGLITILPTVIVGTTVAIFERADQAQSDFQSDD